MLIKTCHSTYFHNVQIQKRSDWYHNKNTCILAPVSPYWVFINSKVHNTVDTVIVTLKNLFVQPKVVRLIQSCYIVFYLTIHWCTFRLQADLKRHCNLHIAHSLTQKKEKEVSITLPYLWWYLGERTFWVLHHDFIPWCDPGFLPLCHGTRCDGYRDSSWTLWLLRAGYSCACVHSHTAAARGWAGLDTAASQLSLTDMSQSQSSLYQNKLLTWTG